MKRIAWAVVAVLALVGALSSCVRLVQESFSDRHEVVEEVTTVEVRNDSGDVVVHGREDATAVEVKRTVDYPRNADKPAGPTHRVEGDTLVLEDCGRNCTVRYEVTVPGVDVKVRGENGSGNVTLERLADVRIEVGSGDVHVRDVSGAVRVENGSGDLVASNVGGDFTGRNGSGNSRLSGMRGAVDVENSSGDLEVGMAAVRSVRAESGSGDVVVRVPKGAYRVAADTGSGDRTVEVASDPAATVEVVVRSGSGNVSVHPAA